MWKQRRRVAALAQAGAVLGIPFLSAGGESLLRVDVPGLKLLFFGRVLWIDEFHLVLLGTLFLLVLAIGATVVFGRVWCGWLCPQTVLPELAGWAASLFPAAWRGSARKALLLPLSAVVSLSLIWYFVPPAEAARQLVSSRMLLGFFLAQWLVIFPLLAFAGVRFCRSVCPYAMLQNVLFDRDTLTVAYDRDRDASCLRCELCVRQCPAGIDIRNGVQRECIACAECIDACRTVTARRGIEPFLAYRGRFFRGKAALAGVAACAAGLAFCTALLVRPGVAFEAHWEEKIGTSGANRYGYAVRNGTGNPVTVRLELEGGAMLMGDREVTVPPRSRRAGKLLARAPGGDARTVVLVASGPGLAARREVTFP